MNIRGYGEVSAIRLKHKGCEMNMQCVLPVEYKEIAEVEPTAIAFLDFKDVSEIETMIHMLSAFKKACIDGMGRWHRE